jgi:hypothetical protein
VLMLSKVELCGKLEYVILLQCQNRKATYRSSCPRIP